MHWCCLSQSLCSAVASNRYAYQTISRHEALELSFMGLIHRLIYGDRTSEVVAESFEVAMSNHAMHLGKLILQGQVVLDLLARLEEHLVVIHEMCMRESLVITDARDQLLADLWTTLGGNQRRLRGIRNHLNLLRNVSRYRTRALTHVLRAMEEISRREELIHELRAQAVVPGIAAGTIPLKIQLESIRSGIERLLDSGANARRKKAEITQQVLVSSDNSEDHD